MWRDDPSSDSVFFLKIVRYTLSSKRADCYRPCFLYLVWRAWSSSGF
nr:MAG TPA: hypothetical protein [Caudoviricetes sp.]